jgi:flagellin
VAAGTTVAQALATLTSNVASNTSLQSAGISVQTATGGSALVFQNLRGERFDVLASGDLNNRLGLGSFTSSAGASGTFDYSAFTGSGAVFGGTGQTVQFSVGGGPVQAVTLAAADTASVTLAAAALNAGFAQNANLSAAQLIATNSGGQLLITSANSSLFRLNAVGADELGLGGTAAAVGVSFTSNAQAGSTAVNSFAAGGAQQTGLIAFTAIRNASEAQTITITADDSSGVTQSLAIKLQNDTTLRTGASVDEAIDKINTTLQQSNNTTLQQVTAVKDKASAGGAEGIRFISNLNSFKVGIGTTGSGAGLGNQATVQSSSLIGTGSTADISSQQGAQSAVTALASAVSVLGSAQAVVGKGQNNFNYAVNLAQSQLGNIAASESRIRDADLASEAANLTKAQITLQAGIAALAQANSAPQAILSLLRG